MCIKILKLLIKYSSIIFDKNNKYRETCKNKMYEFKKETEGEDSEIHKLSLYILKRYYGECLDKNICTVYKYNKRCINVIKHSNLCRIHLQYPNRIIKILKKYIPVDISKKCLQLIF